MSIMTAAEYREQDDRESQYEANYIYAKREWLDQIEAIKQTFEHLLDDTPIADVPLKDIAQIMHSYKQLYRSTMFDYWADEDTVIEYDFLPELKEILKGDYGWEIDNV